MLLPQTFIKEHFGWPWPWPCTTKRGSLWFLTLWPVFCVTHWCPESLVQPKKNSFSKHFQNYLQCWSLAIAKSQWLTMQKSGSKISQPLFSLRVGRKITQPHWDPDFQLARISTFRGCKVCDISRLLCLFGGICCNFQSDLGRDKR